MSEGSGQGERTTGGREPLRMAVAVASFREPALLAACLDSLHRAGAGPDLPVVVARRGDRADVAPVVEGRAGVQVVPTDDAADVPRLRGAALKAAPAAEWIAVTEDHCLAAPDWLERLDEAAEPDVDVVGGGMGNARPGMVEWAAYFSEYGFFSSTRPRTSEGSGTTPLLTGANVAYARTVLPDVARWALDGEWENTIHRRLHARGATLRWQPDARILQNKTYGVADFCRDRYEHGRDYARARLRHESGRPRWLLAAGTPVLPFLLTSRVGRAAARESPGAFLRSLPLTAAFLGAWSVGEAVGYIEGAS